MKKLISVALALVMLLSMSVVAFAAGETITVYCQSPEDWETCHVHYWGSASGESAWPGVLMTKGANGIWSAEIPADAGGLLFNKQGDEGKTSDLTLPTDGKLQFVIGAGWVEPGDLIEVVTKYYVTGNATLCGSEFDPADPNNVMTEGENNIWTKTYENVAAGSYELKVTNGSWDKTWLDDQTGVDMGMDNYKLEVTETTNVTITFDATNETVVVTTGTATGDKTENDKTDNDKTDNDKTDNDKTDNDKTDNDKTENDKTDNEQTTTTTKDYYLVGFINGANYGCEGDSANLGEYKFVNGKLTATFTAESYVFVKTGDNNTWLLAEAYCTDTTCTFKDGGQEKMLVPGNEEITFTLVENTDGTVTVSYAKGGSTGGDKTETESNEKYYVAGVAALCGADWKENDANNAMAKDTNGIWFKAYENVAKGNYSIKVTDGTWTNSWGGDGKDGNYDFTVEADKTTVVVKFDAATKKVTVEVGGKVPATGTGNNTDNNGTTSEADKNVAGTPSAYRVVGNASWMGDWNPASDAGRLLEVSPGVYKKNFENVQPGNYELKITKDGTWDKSWGDNGNNFTFTIVKACTITVTFTLDGENGKIEVKGTGIGDPGTGDYSMVSVVVLMSLAVCCAGILILNKKKFI